MIGLRLVAAVGAMLFACATMVVARGDDPRSIALVDQSGAVFRLADLRGRPALLTFIATRCTDACPLANAAFQRLRAQLRRDRVRARLVTITLDPAYDSPFVMSKLARSLDADPRDWVFASGPPASVHRLMRSLGVVASTGVRGVPDVHTTFVYVLDRRTRLAREMLLSADIVNPAEQAVSDRGAVVGTTNDGK